MKLSLREILLLLLIVPIVAGWIVDRSAKQELIDRYRWQAKAMTRAVGLMKDAKKVQVSDDDIFVHMQDGSEFHSNYGKYLGSPAAKSN